MRYLYTLLIYVAAPLFSLVLFWRGLWDRSYWRNFGERFGFGTRLDRRSIWIHAVSVGEVQAAAPLVTTLRQRYPDTPIVVTTFTPTGAARARVLFKELAHVRYLPFDLPGAVARFLTRAQPRLAVIFETELWPNLYRACGKSRVPLVLASARISPRSMGRYQRLGVLIRETLSQGVVVAAQGEADASRFRELGAAPDSTHVTGNIKFDFSLPADIVERGSRLRERYAAGRPVWVAGSTHGGEEEALLEAQTLIRKSAPNALLVMAPRHPTRFVEVTELLKRRGAKFVRRSRGDSATAGEIDAAEVLLVDTLGELLDFYAAGDIAFVGGSLVPIGGHNLLEPAALGLPILTGPHNGNGAEVARVLEDRGAAQIVANAADLAEKVAALLSDPENRRVRGAAGRAYVEANKGALTNLMGLIVPLLE